MSKPRKCNKTDCFGYNQIFEQCNVLNSSGRDSPCTFYKSDPDGSIRSKIEQDVRNYTKTYGNLK